MSAALLITIAIPTFDRAPKLDRLLQNIDKQLARLNYNSQIEVLVSNNFSKDGTKELLEKWATKVNWLSVVHQAVNLGMDGNMEYLYRNARGNYVWFISDDDLLKENAIEKIFLKVQDTTPAVLLFGFEQPAGTKAQFGSDGPSGFVGDPKRAIRLITKHAKITSYILQRINFSQEEWLYLERFSGSAYWFLSLSLSVLAHGNKNGLYGMEEFLASSDRDFQHLRFPPSVWSGCYLPYTHYYVETHWPNRWKEEKSLAFVSYINVLFAVSCGVLKTNCPEKYEEANRKLSVSIPFALRFPLPTLKAVLVRTGLAKSFYRSYRSVSDFLRVRNKSEKAGN